MTFTKLIKSDEITKQNHHKYLVIRRKIKKILPTVKVIHVGGSSVPGLLTKGDLDIQVRVGYKDFSSVIDILKTDFVEHNLHLWSDYYAIFKEESLFGEKIDILVTAKNYPEDIYFLYTRLLRKRPDLVKEFNQIKLKHHEYHSLEYKQAKDVFFKKLTKIIRDK